LEYISWNNKKSHFFLEKGFHVKRKKRQNVEKGKKRTREQGLKGGEVWSSEAAGLTQVRGVYHQLTGIMG
jgi:hypothetical protein